MATLSNKGSIRKGFKVCKRKFPKRTVLRAFRVKPSASLCCRQDTILCAFPMSVVTLV
jgi:hypothetical protein